MVAPLKGIVEERYVGCIDFDCDINCIHDSTDITQIISQLMPNRLSRETKLFSVTRGRYLPRSEHTVWPADPLSHLLLAIFEIRILWREKKHSASVLSPEPVFLALSGESSTVKLILDLQFITK